MPPDPDELLARASKPAEEALRLHAFYRGKLQVLPKCAIRGLPDLAVWYSPGVAAPCRAIQADPELVYRHTNKGNSVAVVSDGTRVLGLGDIGPEAGLPVMEGKAMLFKYLGGVDAVPLCLATKDPDELIRTVELIEPAFGGINLEDIAQPKCFRVLDALRQRLHIPVWHDDQQGSATGLLAGLLNALEVVGKDLRRVRIAMVGMGAANVAGYRLLTSSGVEPGAIVACDRQGILHRSRRDIEAKQHVFPDKWRVCLESNGDGRIGGIAEALRGADVCAAFSASGPGIIKPEWVRNMARDAIVFACANPVPEIWPWEAKAAGARVVATGRGDFPNQLNNSLVFPGLFRGALDVRRGPSPTGWRARSPTSSLASPARDPSTTRTSCHAWTSGRSSREWRRPREWLRRRRGWRSSRRAGRRCTPKRRGPCGRRARPSGCSCRAASSRSRRPRDDTHADRRLTNGWDRHPLGRVVRGGAEAVRARLLLITGRPGVGKTTVIRKVAAALVGRRLGGFYTEEVLAGRERRGFQLVTFDGREWLMAHADIRGPHRVGKYGVDVATVEAAAVSTLAPGQAELYLVDEIGRMECLSPVFVAALGKLLDSPTTVVATVALRGDGVIAEIKQRPDTEIWTVTRENRDAVPARVLAWLQRSR